MLWNAASGAKVADWPLTEWPTFAVFSADNQYLAVGLWTGVVYVIRLIPAAADA